MNWIDVDKELPEHKPNQDGIVCVALGELGNVYRSRYMHDVYEGGESKYWSEFTVSNDRVENEHYEIMEKITHWSPL